MYKYLDFILKLIFKKKFVLLSFSVLAFSCNNEAEATIESVCEHLNTLDDGDCLEDDDNQPEEKVLRECIDKFTYRAYSQSVLDCLIETNSCMKAESCI